MANVITSSVVSYSGRETTTYLTLVYVDAQETNTLIYDSSAVVAATLATLNPSGYADPLTSRILEIYASCNAVSTARVHLLFDAGTKVVAMNIPTSTNPTKGNFRRIGGLLNNTTASGRTGDILLTTTGLASGDSIILTLTVGAY